MDQIIHNHHAQQGEKILEWLTPVNYGSQQSDHLKRRQPGTGQWLLESREYQSWLTTKGERLFCPGMPGAGKTILTSVVVDHLEKRYLDNATIGISYLYCNFKRQDEQKADNLITSLLKQLAQGQHSLPDSIKSLHDSHQGRHTRPSFKEILKALRSVAALYSRVFVIVDALDECQVSDGCRARFLRELFDFQTKTGANLFITSRDIPEITSKFQGSMSLEIRAMDEDVETYLAGQMEKLPPFVISNPDLQNQIKVKIAKAISGMSV